MLVSSPDPSHRWNLEVCRQRPRDLWPSPFSDTQAFRGLNSLDARHQQWPKWARGPGVQALPLHVGLSPQRDQAEVGTVAPRFLPMRQKVRESGPAAGSVFGPWVLLPFGEFIPSSFCLLAFKLFLLPLHLQERLEGGGGHMEGLFPRAAEPPFPPPRSDSPEDWRCAVESVNKTRPYTQAALAAPSGISLHPVRNSEGFKGCGD